MGGMTMAIGHATRSGSGMANGHTIRYGVTMVMMAIGHTIRIGKMANGHTITNGMMTTGMDGSTRAIGHTMTGTMANGHTTNGTTTGWLPSMNGRTMTMANSQTSNVMKIAMGRSMKMGYNMEMTMDMWHRDRSYDL